MRKALAASLILLHKNVGYLSKLVFIHLTVMEKTGLDNNLFPRITRVNPPCSNTHQDEFY